MKTVNDLISIEAELHAPTADVHLCRFDLADPVESVVPEQDCFWLDMCLTPRLKDARACFPDLWGPNRFERLGKVYVLPPGHEVHARSEGGKQAAVICHLRPEPIHAWFEGDLVWTERRLEACLDVTEVNIRNLLMRLAAETRHPGFASEALAELIAAQLAIELARYYAKVKEGPAAGGLGPWRLRMIDERLREVGAAPTLAELAELCGLSVRQLTRGFRKSRGCSIGDYIAAARTESAKRLLAREASIKVIAYSMGFASSSSFSFAFRKATGETPLHYQRRTRDFAH